MGDMWKARTTLGSHASSRSRKPSLLVYGPDTQEQNESKAKAQRLRDKMAYKRRITRLEHEKKVAIRDARSAATPVKKSIVFGPRQFPPGTRAARTTPNNFEFETASREDFVREYNSERPPDRPITSAAVKEVYPLKEKVDAARESEYGAGKGTRAGVNPIRSKYMDVDIVLNKQRSARIKERATPLVRSDDRRMLEEQWKPNDYESRGQTVAKKRNQRARLKAAAAVDDATFPRIPPGRGFEYPSDKPSQTAIDINAEKARRKAFEDRATRLREARVRQLVRSGTPVPVEVPKPAPVRRPVVQKSNEQIRIDAEKSAAASSGRTTYRYPPMPSPVPTTGPTTVGDVSPSSAERQRQAALRRTEQTPADRARRAAIIAENKTRIRLEAEELAAKRARAARMATNINAARAKLASNPVLSRLGKAQGPVITNPSDLLTEYGKAGRAARLAKAQASSTNSSFLRSKSVSPFPGTTNKPKLPNF